MGLLDEVAREAVAHKPTKCIVARWLDTLNKKDRSDVEEVIVSAHPYTAMYRVINRHFPQQFGERSFTKHLEGGCCCVSEG